MGDFGSMVSVKKCRKPYVCVFCDRTIPVGNPWEGYRGLWEGEFQTWKACVSCAKHVFPLVQDEGWFEGSAAFISFIESEEDTRQGKAAWMWVDNRQSIMLTWEDGETKTIPYPYKV